MNADRSFGDWLRQRRRALDLTQEELARQVGCSAITLRKLEAEERRPSKQIAERLAVVLQVAPDDRPTFLRFARGDPFVGPTAAQSAGPPGQAKPAPQNLLEVKLLGRFQLLIGGEPIAAVNTPRLQSLFAYLLLRRGVPQSRQTLAFMLWPESTDAQARTNLRTLLHRLRAALPQAETCLSLEAQAVMWLPSSAYRLDVDDFEAAVNAAALAADEASARIAFERANELYQGELFPECYDDWISAERERLHQLAVGVLERLVALLERGGLYADALERGQRLLQLDPLRESTYLSLMRLHLLQGARASALRVYHQYAATLHDELAVEPGPAMRSAYTEMMAAEAADTLAVAPLAISFPVVGREAEQARLRSLWRTAAQGQPQLLAVVGEAGLGKTRLAEDVLAWAERQGAATAIARCYAAEGDLAFAPVTAWLRSEAIRPGLARLDAIWLAEVARLAPEVLLERPDLTSPGAMTEGWQRRRLLEALARAMLAGDRPALLMLDDLQWCDPDTLEWLQFLLHHAPRARLMVLATLRPEEAEPHRPLAGLLNDLRRGNQLTEIVLQPLTPAQTAALAGHIAGRELVAAEAAGLYAETEGNPLFIVETLRAGWLREPGAAATPLPPGVQSVIAHRLDQLTPEAGELLAVAAVIGRSFSVRALARAADVGEPVFVRGLDELWHRRLVREQGADAYDFSHDKLRAAAYASLSPAHRRLLHRRAAEAMEGDPDTDRDAASGQIAAHFEHAGQPERAATYYGQAAEVAQRVFANAEAIGHLRRALALLAPLEAPAKRIEAATFAERLGDLLGISRQFAEAREAYQQSLQLLAPADGSTSQARLALARLQHQIGYTWRESYHHAEAFAAYDAAEADLRLTADATDPGLWQAWVQIQMSRLQTHYWLFQFPEMFALIDLVRPVVERHGSPLQQGLLSQYVAMGLIERDRGGSEAAVQAVAAYLGAVEAAGASGALPGARFMLGFVILFSGDLDRAEPELLAALGMAERTGDISLEVRCLTYLTILSRKRRQIEAVRAYAGRSLRGAALAEMPEYISAAKANQAWLAGRAGDRVQAQALGQQAVDEWGRMPIAYPVQWLALWPLLAAALADGQFPAAIAHARAMLDSKQFRLPEFLDNTLAEAVRAADAGDQEAARAALLAAQGPAADLGFL